MGTTPSRDSVRLLSTAIKSACGIETSLNTSPLGMFKINIDSVELCDWILSRNAKLSTGHVFDVNHAGNRNLKKANQLRLEQAMRIGTWDSNNGETIKIATNPDGKFILTDGQHRVEAIRSVLSDPDSGIAAVEITVICGMDSKSLLTVDTGASRSAADFLTMCSPEIDNMYTSDVASAGRDAYRSVAGSHPIKKPILAFSEGDLARWLMEEKVGDCLIPVGEELRDIRHSYTKTLGKIASTSFRGGNAGAKSWMTYLMWEWLQKDPKLAIEIIGYLASGQTTDLPRYKNGTPMRHWEWARSAAIAWHIDSQGFKASNKELHDRILVMYAFAWNISRGERVKKPCTAAGMQNDVIARFFNSGKKNSYGKPLPKKTPDWPGIA